MTIDQQYPSPVEVAVQKDRARLAQRAKFASGIFNTLSVITLVLGGISLFLTILFTSTMVGAAGNNDEAGLASGIASTITAFGMLGGGVSVAVTVVVTAVSWAFFTLASVHAGYIAEKVWTPTA